MKLVIDIPENIYQAIMDSQIFMTGQRSGKTLLGVLVSGVYKGTPLPKGKWIPQKGGGFRCSNCKSYSLHEMDGNYIHVSARTKYCHNCGAKMEAE